MRKDGQLKTVPMAWKTREVPFAHGARTAVTIPWGDVFTAWVSTGVADVEVYLSMPPKAVANMRRMATFSSVLRWGWVQNYLRRKIDARIGGQPDPATGIAQQGDARIVRRPVEGSRQAQQGDDRQQPQH